MFLYTWHSLLLMQSVTVIVTIINKLNMAVPQASREVGCSPQIFKFMFRVWNHQAIPSLVICFVYDTPEDTRVGCPELGFKPSVTAWLFCGSHTDHSKVGHIKNANVHAAGITEVILIVLLRVATQVEDTDIAVRVGHDETNLKRHVQGIFNYQDEWRQLDGDVQ